MSSLDRIPPQHQQAVTDLVRDYVKKTDVDAIAIGGSLGAGTGDSSSDIDLYVYATKIPPVEIRKKIITQRADKYEVGNDYWEPGDEWIERKTKIGVDVMYRTKVWIENELASVIDKGEAKMGYTTAFWYNVRHSLNMYDKNGWYDRLQKKASRSFPERLKDEIIRKNLPVLKDSLSSIKTQIEKAIDRSDLISVNHRVAAWISSYTEIVLAVNYKLHPGEKKILDFLVRNCELLPERISEDLEELITKSSSGKAETLLLIDKMVERLKKII